MIDNYKQRMSIEYRQLTVMKEYREILIERATIEEVNL